MALKEGDEGNQERAKARTVMKTPLMILCKLGKLCAIEKRGEEAR